MDANVLSKSGQKDNIICMDLLNYSNGFFDIPHREENKTVDFEADVEIAKKKVKNFIHASSNSGYKIICFIDESMSTKETYDKWISRRTKELEVGKKNVVANMSFILGSIFQSHGIDVHFTKLDCDDTIAAFAYHKGGSVLSRDCDFFRYYVPGSIKNPPYDVFFNYNIVDGKIIFDKHFGPSSYRPKASPREIMSTLPTTEKTTFFLGSIPSFLGISKGQRVKEMNQRGCGSNLTQEKNPHLQVDICDYFKIPPLIIQNTTHLYYFIICRLES